MLLLWLALPARATFPLPTYPDCGEPDRPDLCPSDLYESWDLLSHVPERWKEGKRPEEVDQPTGLSADRAWRVSTGRSDVVIAVLDSGILWEDEELIRKHYINRSELPLPQNADGTEIEDGDLDGNGVHNIEDWAMDPRVDWAAGVDVADHMLDPSDLIATFSDGVDDDDNGYIDDISGWDFLWNDNDPYDDNRYDHGTFEAWLSAAEGDGGGGWIGVCPNCMVMSVRVGDSFVADGANFAAAVLYSVDSGADVIQEALGTMNHPPYATEAISYAWEQDVLVVASAADETSYHPNAPGWVARTFYVHSNTYDGDDEEDSASFLAYSNCTNHGARLDASAPSNYCSSGATGMAAGTVGLVLSAARDAGRELTAMQVHSLLLATVDDIDVAESREEGSLYYPSQPGWDRYFGAGRINAERAVLAASSGQLPPAIELLSPGWFDVHDPGETTLPIELVVEEGVGETSWSLEVGVGVEPATWRLLEEGSGPINGVVGEVDLMALLADGLSPEGGLEDWVLGQDQVDRELALDRYAFTVRLTATDSAGQRSSVRRTAYLLDDPDFTGLFPMQLGGSLEASPTLIDVDGDGILDIIQADAQGQVHVLGGDGAVKPGWPVQLGLLEEADPAEAGNHLGSAGWAALGEASASVVSSPAAGDLDGDGDIEIVVATLRGELYVLDHDGQLLPGFPVRQMEVGATGPNRLLDEGFFSSPALGDLDGDGDLEIVIGGMDQRVYALHHDGSALSGWPVLAVYPGFEEDGSRIISSPALGDLNRDGLVDVVIGTNETLSETRGPVYAIDARGNNAPSPYLDGWPQRLFGAYTQALPVVGEGVPGSPALADIDGDGDLEVTAHTLAGDLPVFEHDGTERYLAHLTADGFGARTNLNDAALFPLINSSSFGDLDGDGLPDLVTGGIGTGYAVGLQYDGRRSPFDHGVGAWSGLTGDYLPGWPRVIEDLQFFANPAIADIDGDGKMEVISGSGGGVLHAWNVDGVEPEGWPKFTGHWILSSPAVGDVDGDGDLDVVVGTRQGWLFVWSTSASAGAAVAWAGFGHDPQHTRNHEAPLPDGYNTGTGTGDDGSADSGGPTAGGGPEPTSGAYKGGCGCNASPLTTAWPALLASLALLRRRRVRW